MRRLLILSGPIGAGKTSLGRSLVERYGAEIVKTRELIVARLPETEQTREALQLAGEALDRDQGGRWVADAIASRDLSSDLVIVDSVRTVDQVNCIREKFSGIRVQHIHVWAPETILAERYRNRASTGDDQAAFSVARANTTEAAIGELEDICDVLIDTARNRAEDVLVRAAARLGFYHVREKASVDVLVGGQWGSEGKGHIAWYVAREYGLLMRVGGPNAGHSTIDPYKFHILPSGTIINPNAKLLIGPGATIRVSTLLREIEECHVTAQRLSIDPQAMIIEDADIEVERASLNDISSTAQGGGFAAARRLMRSRLKDASPVRFAKDVEELRPYIRSTLQILEDSYANGEKTFVEGTQGSGLSLFHGPFPFVTSRDTTVSGTLAECGIPPGRVRRVIMVVRSYPIRVGGPSGPLAEEIDWEVIAARAKLNESDLRAREITTTTKRPRRVGEFDWGLIRQSCILNAPTDLALSFVDYLDGENQNARRFEQLTSQTIRFIEELERVGDTNVSLISTRFHPRSIIDRRSW